MPMTIAWTVRPATLQDVNALIALRAQLLDGASNASYASRTAEESQSWKAAYQAWLTQVLPGDQQIRIVVAEQASKIVACATGLIDRRPPSPDSLSGRCGWVQSVVVAPAYQRQGIAKLLMCELLKWFSGRGATKVQLETTPAAETLYRKLGFKRSPEGLLSFVGGRS